MMLTKITTITAILISSMVAFGNEPPVLPTPAEEKITQPKMFPDGRDYDFGKVKRGPRLKHAFRIVNTSNVPLSIISIRCG